MKVLHRHLLNQRVLKFSLVVFVRIEKYFLTNKVAALLGRFWRPRNCQDNAFLINDHSRHWFNGIILLLVVLLLGILDRLFDGAIIALVLRLTVLLLSLDEAIIAVTPAITIADVTCQIDQVSFPHRLQFCVRVRFMSIRLPGINRRIGS